MRDSPFVARSSAVSSMRRSCQLSSMKDTSGGTASATEAWDSKSEELRRFTRSSQDRRVPLFSQGGFPMRGSVLKIAACGALVALVACSGTSQTSTVAPATPPIEPAREVPTTVLSGSAADGIHKIAHVVVIMQENRSFDTYFGTYPGVDGIPMVDGK